MKIERIIIMVNLFLFVIMGCGSQRHIIVDKPAIYHTVTTSIVHDTLRTRRVYSPEELKLQAQMRKVIQDAEPTFKDITEIKESTKKMSQAIDDMAKIALIGIQRSQELRRQNDSISSANSKLIHTILTNQTTQSKSENNYYLKTRQLDYYKDQAISQNNALKYFTWSGGICFFMTWMLNLIVQRKLLQYIDKKFTTI